jgi:hypothetical protein
MISYYIEGKCLEEFLMLQKNNELTKTLKSVFVELPEGVIIQSEDPQAKDSLFMNEKAKDYFQEDLKIEISQSGLLEESMNED